MKSGAYRKNTNGLRVWSLLRVADRRRLLKDLRFAPAWMHPHLRFIAGEEKPA